MIVLRTLEPERMLGDPIQNIDMTVVSQIESRDWYLSPDPAQKDVEEEHTGRK